MEIEKTAIKKKSISKKAVAPDMVKQEKEIFTACSKDPQKILEAIRLKAHELYVERNGTPGGALEDWLAAERIVLQDTHK
jgi:hypothetical protein